MEILGWILVGVVTSIVCGFFGAFVFEILKYKIEN